MKRYLILFILLAGSARADAPQMEVVRKFCVDGELRGIVIKTQGAGLYGVRWGHDICKDET